ncbi:MAG: bifunctional oligoribonuclease/PAP phosphatase NrnA [Treponema sp.]|nr:bifunctional oligoribonuclease/PAP phosphatase NrnA [Treponema sp.]
MFASILSFIDRHDSFILTTHDSPDADGLGAEAVLASILKKKGKQAKIIHSSPIPRYLEFIKEGFEIEQWDPLKHAHLLENSALLVLDTSEEHHLGSIREVVKKVRECFVIDHHDPKPVAKLTGLIDSTASSVSEISIELTCNIGIDLDPFTATAAYAGIVSDSGFFAYPKTSMRTFKAAMKTLEWGAAPNLIYRQLMENSSCASVLLQKQALSSLEFHAGKKIALMTLHWEDFVEAEAEFEEVENIVNIPLRAREVEASLLIREKEHGEIFCSLRSKGTLNVSKIAQNFGGGGHVTAAGFRSYTGIEETIKKLLSCVRTQVGSE